MHLPDNVTFEVSRNRSTVLSNVPALCVPARPEIVALYDVPAGKAYQVTFNGLFDIKEQDLLINQADATETYRVTSVAQYETPRLAHTEAVAVAMWGTE